jgi:hypothetical protein
MPDTRHPSRKGECANRSPAWPFVSYPTMDRVRACFQSSLQKLICWGGSMWNCVCNARSTDVTDSFSANCTTCRLFCWGVAFCRTSGIWWQQRATMSHTLCVSIWKCKVILWPSCIMPQAYLLKNGDNMFTQSSLHVCGRQLHRITNVTTQHPILNVF